MWEYTKIIPTSVLYRRFPSARRGDVMDLIEHEFAQECSEVLGKAMKYEVTEDPQSHGVRLTATLITEPKEADMGTMGTMGTMGAYGAGNWVAVDPPGSGKGKYSYTATELIRQGDMVVYKDRKVAPKPFRQALRDEINEWLKM